MYATLAFDQIERKLRVRCFGAPVGATFEFTLHRHSKVIDTFTTAGKTQHAWNIDDQSPSMGDFYVSVKIPESGTLVETEWQFVPGLHDLKKQESTWAEDRDDPLRLGDVRPPVVAEPHGNLAYIQVLKEPEAGMHDKLTKISEFGASIESILYSVQCGAEDLTRYSRQVQSANTLQGVEGRRYVLSSSDPITNAPAEGATAFGCGYAYHDRVLRKKSAVALSLTDVNVWQDAPSPRNVSRCTGEFVACVCYEDGTVEFHSDYAGTGAWYEYRSSSFRIIASSFLLAVRIAQLLGQELALNLDVIDADFTSLVQPFQQPLLDDLEIQGFSILRPDRVLALRSTGEAYLVPSQLGSDISAPCSFTTEKYEQLLDSAAHELMDNCTAILDDELIEEVRCDITGGLDSRVVLAAFLGSKSDNIFKLSLYTASAARGANAADEKIASFISQEMGVHFSSRGETHVGPCSTGHLASKQVGATFGTYWHRSHGHSLVPDPKMIYVGGAGLGNIARDYTTEAWGVSNLPVSAPEEMTVSLAQTIYKWRGRATMKAAPRSGVLDIARSWEDIPGSGSEKAGHIFNFFRARLHGGGKVSAALGAWTVSPGVTRSLYQLRLMVGSLLSGPRVQLELCRRLAPQLAAIPYDKEKYNRTYSSLFGKMRTMLQTDHEHLLKARIASEANTNWLDCRVCHPNAKANDETGRGGLVEMANRAISEMSVDPQLSDILFVAQRWADNQLGVRYGVDHSYGKTFVNKILHLHTMWKICGASSGVEV